MVSRSKKVQKERARNDIDQIINDIIFPESQVEKPGRYNRHNINLVLISYAYALQKEATSTTIQFQNTQQHVVKRKIKASYDLENKYSFPAIETKSKTFKKKY